MVNLRRVAAYSAFNSLVASSQENLLVDRGLEHDAA